MIFNHFLSETWEIQNPRWPPIWSSIMKVRHGRICLALLDRILPLAIHSKHILRMQGQSWTPGTIDNANRASKWRNLYRKFDISQKQNHHNDRQKTWRFAKNDKVTLNFNLSSIREMHWHGNSNWQDNDTAYIQSSSVNQDGWRQCCQTGSWFIINGPRTALSFTYTYATYSRHDVMFLWRNIAHIADNLVRIVRTFKPLIKYVKMQGVLPRT